jgi:hypothetical protein
VIQFATKLNLKEIVYRREIKQFRESGSFPLEARNLKEKKKEKQGKRALFL